jgi:hypothetical protein
LWHLSKLSIIKIEREGISSPTKKKLGARPLKQKEKNKRTEQVKGPVQQ